MELRFFGRGSGFSDEHTSACFTTENQEMVIIDCPVSTYNKLKHMDLLNYEELYIFITHTHGDHIGGLGLFIQYAYFVLGKSVNIVVPSSLVSDDISMLLRIEGCKHPWYKIIESNLLRNKDWVVNAIQTEHVAELQGKCYGYRFYINDKNIIYTGDTSTLEPYLPYLTDNSILYVDTSVYYGKVHLKLKDILDEFISLTQRGIKVYLMHLDDILSAEEIVQNIPGVEVVTVD